MASKKFLELQDLSNEDLLGELEATEKDFLKMRFDHAVKGLDNPMELREMRRDIARLQTEKRRRELSGMEPTQVAKRSKIRERRRRG